MILLSQHQELKGASLVRYRLLLEAHSLRFRSNKLLKNVIECYYLIILHHYFAVACMLGLSAMFRLLAFHCMTEVVVISWCPVYYDFK